MLLYIGAPLHDVEDRMYTDRWVKKLHQAGYKCYNCHTKGVWESMMKELTDKGCPEKEAKNIVKQECMKGDDLAMNRCDAGVFSFNYEHRKEKGPSEGMVWEMGYLYGIHKPYYIIDPFGWDWNLMLELHCSKIFNDVDGLIAYLKNQEFTDGYCGLSGD